MPHEVSKAEIRQAQFPHNLFISAIFLFDVLLAPAAIALDIGLYALMLPLVLSGAVMAYIYVRSQSKQDSWFVNAHWKWTFSHCRWLMVGYAVSAVCMALAALLSMAAHDQNMKHIMLIALTRIAIIPTFVAVMVTLVMEASAFAQAGRGEVTEKHTPPAV